MVKLNIKFFMVLIIQKQKQNLMFLSTFVPKTFAVH